MKTPIYNVKDLRIGTWQLPNFLYRNDADAIRGFELAVNKDGTMFNAFPTDYGFYKIGEWDDETGVITTHDQPISLGIAADYKKQLAPTLKDVSQ